MSTAGRLGRLAALTLAAVLSTVSAAGAAGINARVAGTFRMRARVTVAVDVRGEHAGELLWRRWVIASRDCRGDICRTLTLRRQRSDHRDSRLTLHRIGAGRYAGRGEFGVAISCRGRVHRRGGRAPYTITLRVAAAATVGGVRFARRITAGYDNPGRTDTTRCPLGPSHDAARYTGRASSPLPVAPPTSFSAAVDPTTDTAAFTKTVSRRRDHSRLVARRWRFGDPRSGASNRSSARDPVHRFSAPGIYRVTLTETDRAGLSTTTARRIVAPGPPTAAFSPTISGLEATFDDRSAAGIGRAPIVAWTWDFGDPGSGAADSSGLVEPSHVFTAPGTYVVTLTVVDGNGRSSSSSEAISVSGG